MPKVFIKDIDRGFNRLASDVKKGGMRVKIGVQGSDAQKVKQLRDGKKADVTVVDVATFHEFGVDSGGRHIPERSFLRATIDINRDKYNAVLKAGLKAIALGKLTQEQVLNRLGLNVQHDCVARINNGLSPANSPATIRRKKSAKPLIDTGQLKQSITWVIDKERK